MGGGETDNLSGTILPYWYYVALLDFAGLRACWGGEREFIRNRIPYLK